MGTHFCFLLIKITEVLHPGGKCNHAEFRKE